MPLDLMEWIIVDTFNFSILFALSFVVIFECFGHAISLTFFHIFGHLWFDRSIHPKGGTRDQGASS